MHVSVRGHFNYECMRKHDAVNNSVCLYDCSETMENERELMENRCENKINNLKSSLKDYYSQQLEVRPVTDFITELLNFALLSSTVHTVKFSGVFILLTNNVKYRVA